MPTVGVHCQQLVRLTMSVVGWFDREGISLQVSPSFSHVLVVGYMPQRNAEALLTELKELLH